MNERDAEVRVPQGDRAMDRRDFLKWGAGVSIAGSCLLAGAAVARAVVPPERSIDGKTKMPPTALVGVADLKEGVPQLFEYGDDAVYLTKLSGNKIIALSAACPHVACKLAWDAQKAEFACPCHASFFTIDGTKVSGPAVRNMDPAIFEVKDGKIVVSGITQPA